MGAFKKRGKKKFTTAVDEKDVAGVGCYPAGAVLPAGVNPATVAEMTEMHPLGCPPPGTAVNGWDRLKTELANRRVGIESKEAFTTASRAAMEELRHKREYFKQRLDLARTEYRPLESEEFARRLSEVEDELRKLEGPSPWNHPFGKVSPEQRAEELRRLDSTGSILDKSALAEMMEKMMQSMSFPPSLMPPPGTPIFKRDEDEEEDSEMSVIQKEILRVKKERLEEMREKKNLLRPAPVPPILGTPEAPKIALRVAKMPLHKMWNVFGDYDLIVQVIHRAWSKSEGDYEVTIHYFMIGGKWGIGVVVPDAELLACVVFGDVKATVMETEEKS